MTASDRAHLENLAFDKLDVVFLTRTPLLSGGGVDARSRKYREATFDGADGVVLIKKSQFFGQHHPVCAG
jgi:hypothetical protein